MRKPVPLLTAALLLAPVVHAQPQHHHWFFGFGAGLDLSTPVPTPVTGPLSTDEGCTSISDANGQLLFFSNGETVWDRTLSLMPNGTGLLGHFSSSQAALIVPMPDDSLRFYLFTTPSEAGMWSGQASASYSIVDMSLNGGLGDVAQKNQLLAGPVTEKLTAVRHANGKDVWVLFHGWGNAEYLAYLVTCTGIEGPVVSTLGHAPGPDAANSAIGAIGCMRLDREGKHLAAVWTEALVPAPGSYSSRVLVDLLDFNAQQGTLSQLRTDTIEGSGSDILKGYGVEWSPSGRMLYVSNNGLINGMSSSLVYQYDMNAPDPVVSRVTVGSGNPAHGTLQSAPDGTIYIARLNGAQYLAAITDPEQPGPACGYVNAAVLLDGPASTWGLPNHWDTYPEPPPPDPLAISDTLVCDASGGILLSVPWEHPFHVPNYLWSTGGTSSSITVTEAGTYWVEVQLPCSTLTDTVRVEVGAGAVELGPDLMVCEGDQIMLSVGQGLEEVLWSTGDTTDAILVTRPDHYQVYVTDSLGCSTHDQVVVDFLDCTCPMYLPNTFTPNGDGINDEFLAVHDCPVITFQLVVFDRWGRELFRSVDPDKAWKGVDDPASTGTALFAWTLDYSWYDGEQVNRAHRNGHVTVLR